MSLCRKSLRQFLLRRGPYVLSHIFFSLRSEGITRTLSMDVNEWNPFEEEEDVLFGKEFDKLRRGSNSSEYFFTHFNMQC